MFGKRESKTGPYASVLGIFKRQKRKNKPLTVVGDGSQRRDFTSVDDVVIANTLACNHKEKLNSEIFNVGSGNNYSILEIAKLISNNIEFLPARIGESKETLANITKISKNCTAGRKYWYAIGMPTINESFHLVFFLIFLFSENV